MQVKNHASKVLSLAAARVSEDFPERESDIYDLCVEAPCPEHGADWLVRVQHQQRRIKDGRKLRPVLDAAPVLTEVTFVRPASNGRRARTVCQQIKVVRVTLKAPARPDRTLPDTALSPCCSPPSPTHPPTRTRSIGCC